MFVENPNKHGENNPQHILTTTPFPIGARSSVPSSHLMQQDQE